MMHALDRYGEISTDTSSPILTPLPHSNIVYFLLPLCLLPLQNPHWLIAFDKEPLRLLLWQWGMRYRCDRAIKIAQIHWKRASFK